MTERRDSVLECASLLALSDTGIDVQTPLHGMSHVAYAKPQRAATLHKLARMAVLLVLATSCVYAHDRHATAAMNQDVRVLIEKDHVEATFVLDTNEEGIMVEAIAMDANGDGRLSPDEQAGYFAHLDARLREGLQITIGGHDVALSPSAGVDLDPPARKTFHFRGDIHLDPTIPAMVAVHNDNFLDWPGRTALSMETSDDLRRDVDFNYSSPTGDSGVVLLFQRGRPKDPKLDWNEWTWPRRLSSPLIIKLASALLLVVGSASMIMRSSSVTRTIIGVTLIATGLACLGFALLRSQHRPVPEVVWRGEFLLFHDKLSGALVQYHQNGNSAPIAPLGSPDVVGKLTHATRVTNPEDEKSGTFELRRMRSQSITFLSKPKYPTNSILRVHYEWRAIGVMRHEGHPHERSRDFSCDYTLRVTDHGLELLDCSDWHQLPDEPIE